MNSFLQKVFLDNTILSYLICFGIILLALFIKRVLSKYLAGIVFRFIRKKSWEEEKATFVELLLTPTEVFLSVSIALIALDRLQFPHVFEFNIHHVSSKSIVDGIGNTVFIVSIIWLSLRCIDFIAAILGKKANLTHDQTDNQMVVFFRDFFKVVLVLLGVLLVIKFSFGANIGSLLAGFGIVAGALALAARESLENLIASFIIFFDRPFHTGDLVKVQQITGTVEKIGLRSTRIRTDQKTYVTVPNKQMVDSIMDNLTLRTQRRVDIRLEISLNCSSEKLEQLVGGVQRILEHRPLKAKPFS
jgi:MscS family membrane protein